MARKLLKRWLPDSSTFKKTPALRFMGKLLHDPNLFHLNRHSVSVAAFTGVFVAFLPILGQMPLAAFLAILFRCNMPIAVAICWISNPITFPAIIYGTYEVGRWILNSPPAKFSIELSWRWLSEDFPLIWQPLLTGSILTGLALGFLAYLCMQGFWYWSVMRNWGIRKEKRIKKEKPSRK